MELSTAKKFMNAINSAGIKKYQFDTDLGTHYYNNDNAICLIDESEAAVINIRKSFSKDTGCSYNGNILLYVSNFCDIHEARVGGTYEEIKKFIEAYGLPLSNDQLKILLNIDKTNYNIIPPSGDYLIFKEKSEDEIAKMTDDEKAAYEKDLEEYRNSEKLKGLSQGTAAQITI